MATKKNKDNKGPATQSTGTQGVNAVGVNHGTNKGYVAYSTYSPDAAPVPGKKLNVVGVPGATVAPAPWEAQQPVQQPAQAQSPSNGKAYNNYQVGGKWKHEGVPGATVRPGRMDELAQRQNDSAKYVPEGTFNEHVGEGYTDQVAAAKAKVPTQNNTNAQQIPANQPVQTAPTANTVQVGQQQFALPQQITYGGKTINLQPQQQPVQQQGPMPQQVTIGNNTYQMPTQTDTNASVQQPKEPTAAQQNAEYEARKQQEAEKEQYNQLVDEYRKAGGNPNAIRSHEDPNIAGLQPTEEQAKKADDYAKSQGAAAVGGDDETIKTLKEYLDSKYESPDDRKAREKREARQRRWAAITEGLANVVNVGGAIGGARPAQWKSGVDELYANQEANADKRRAEYREALRDMITYRNAIRNGDIAQARAIEDKRKNDIYEYRIIQEQEAKAAERKLKAEAQEKDQARKDQEAKNKQRQYDDKHEEHVDKKARGYTTARTSSGGGGRKKSSGGSRATGAAAAKSAKAAAKRRAKAATQGTKFGKK